MPRSVSYQPLQSLLQMLMPFFVCCRRPCYLSSKTRTSDISSVPEIACFLSRFHHCCLCHLRVPTSQRGSGRKVVSLSDSSCRSESCPVWLQHTLVDISVDHSPHQLARELSQLPGGSSKAQSRHQEPLSPIGQGTPAAAAFWRTGRRESRQTYRR
jgi:hypothetical protein